MALENIPIWQIILFFIFMFIAIWIYVKLSKVQIIGVKLIPLTYRILIALIFPIIILIFFLIGSAVVALILLILFMIFLFSLFGRKKVYRIRL